MVPGVSGSEIAQARSGGNRGGSGRRTDERRHAVAAPRDDWREGGGDLDAGNVDRNISHRSTGTRRSPVESVTYGLRFTARIEMSCRSELRTVLLVREPHPAAVDRQYFHWYDSSRLSSSPPSLANPNRLTDVRVFARQITFRLTPFTYSYKTSRRIHGLPAFDRGPPCQACS